MLENSAIGIVVAALFVPFLSQVMAFSFGAWMRDRKLALHGLLAVGVSIVCSVAAGAVVAAMHGGPPAFQDFKRRAVSFAISAVIGIAAGLAVADDAGRRYLIGVAAAVQYAIFPCWFGISLVVGFPDSHVTALRLETFAINVVTIAAGSAIAYAAAGLFAIRKRE